VQAALESKHRGWRYREKHLLCRYERGRRSLHDLATLRHRSSVETSCYVKAILRCKQRWNRSSVRGDIARNISCDRIYINICIYKYIRSIGTIFWFRRPLYVHDLATLRHRLPVETSCDVKAILRCKRCWNRSDVSAVCYS